MEGIADYVFIRPLEVASRIDALPVPAGNLPAAGGH